jgi:hypothetical protein
MTVPVYKIQPLVQPRCENVKTSRQKWTGKLKHTQHDNMYDKLKISEHKNKCWCLVEWWWWCSWLTMMRVIKWQGAYAWGRDKRFTEERCILRLLCFLRVLIHLLAWRHNTFQLMHTFQALIYGIVYFKELMT